MLDKLQNTSYQRQEACPLAASRRHFLKKASTIAIGGILGVSILPGCDSATEELPENATDLNGNVLTVYLARATTLESAGGYVLVSKVDGTDVNVLVINNEGTHNAFSSICTHAGTVSNNYRVSIYAAGDGRLQCPIHNSYFNLDGEPVAGPAFNLDKGDLDKYSVVTDGNTVKITLS